MSRTSLGVVGFFLLLVGLALAPESAPGQGAKELEPPEKVRFDTADGVRLHGKFYRSTAKGAPAVIMLHNLGLGESSSKERWIELAKTLQQYFSVLTFDFRGHGDSIEIEPSLYCKYPNNMKITKGAGLNKTKLDWKDIDKNNYPVFCNDIAAAKSYLERTKNDLGMCNTQNTIVIGVEQSAALAAIWANSEWYRYKIDFQPPFYQVRPENRPEGQYLSALVCLSITSKLGTQTLPLSRTLDFSGKQNAMPIAFIHTDGDPKDKESLRDKETARSLEKAIKGTAKAGETKYQFTKAVEIKGAGKLKGVDLLLNSLKTAEYLNGYLKAVVDENRQEWTAREFVKNKYAWKINPNPNVLPIPAKVFNFQNPFPPSQIFPPGLPLHDAVEKNIIYDNYERFVGR